MGVAGRIPIRRRPSGSSNYKFYYVAPPENNLSLDSRLTDSLIPFEQVFIHVGMTMVNGCSITKLVFIIAVIRYSRYTDIITI